jgi:hypothetical protein
VESRKSILLRNPNGHLCEVIAAAPEANLHPVGYRPRNSHKIPEKCLHRHARRRPGAFRPMANRS